MKIFDIGAKGFSLKEIPQVLPENGLLILCDAGEVRDLAMRFGWDEGTVAECASSDEAIRYAVYDEYDFISLIHVEVTGGAVIQREVNLFVSRQYIVLALPDHAGDCLSVFADALCHTVENTRPNNPEQLYQLVFGKLAADYSDALEKLEDDMEALSEAVAEEPRKSQINEIVRLRKAAYTIRKILRAISYMGDDILMDENSLLHKRQARHLRSINTRFKSLYDFAASLYELSGEILGIYDSNLSIKMNESINKLTAIMLFLALITMITGVFSMDFRFLPEIDLVVGYPLALGLMAVICFVIYRILRKRQWL